MSKSAAGGSAALIWAQGIAFGVVATLMSATAALVVAFLAPGLLALLLDRQGGRPIARAMLLFGMAASAMPLRQLWDTPQDILTTLSAVAHLESLGVSWLAAAAGWFLAELCPVAIHVALDTGGKARASRLRLAREKLLETWGGSITP